MKNIFYNIFIYSFLSIFAVVFIFLFYSNFNLITKFEKSKSFVQGPAIVNNYELKTGSGKNKTSKIFVEYEYIYKGVKYKSNSLEISNFGNNFTDEKKKEQIKYLENKNILIWIDPINPNNSYIFKNFPYQDITFINFFIIFPCFLGLLFLTSLPISLKNLILKKNFNDKNYQIDTFDNFVGYLNYILFIFYPFILVFFYYKELTYRAFLFNFIIFFLFSFFKFKEKIISLFR